MTPIDLDAARLLAPWTGPDPASVRDWAVACPAATSPAFVDRLLQRHATLVAFVERQRWLGAADERVRLDETLTLPVAWSAAFVLEREPIPKPRPRARVIPGDKPFAHIYTPAEATKEEQILDKLAAEHAPAAPWTGPVLLVVEARLPLPASWPKWQREAALARRVAATPRGSGDGDNYAKLLQDGLSRSSRWWLDDSQVVELRARKVYAETTPSWLVEVYLLREVASKAEWEAFKAERELKPRAGAPAQRSLLEGAA